MATFLGLWQLLGPIPGISDTGHKSKNIKTRLSRWNTSLYLWIYSSWGVWRSRTQARHIWRQTGPAGAHSSVLASVPVLYSSLSRALQCQYFSSPLIGQVWRFQASDWLTVNLQLPVSGGGWGWLLFCCVDMHRDEQTDGGMCYTCPENIWGQGKIASIYTNNDQHPSFVRLFHVIIDACVRKLMKYLLLSLHIEQNICCWFEF